MKNRIALIPARGGSKRIPRKNIRLFHGKPMIAWTISCLKSTGSFSHIVVSTDDQRIQDISIQYGAQCPFIRPAELSGDLVPTRDVVLHALDFLEQIQTVDLLVCAYPTAPFLLPEDVNKAISIVESDASAYVLAATEFPYPVQRGFRILSNGLTHMIDPDNYSKRSQELENTYHDAGLFYVANPSTWRHRVNTFNGSIPVIIPKHRSHDIDDLEDWKRAEIMFEALN